MAESIDFQFPHLFPEVMDANVYTATITDIDYDNDTADITIAEIGSFENVEIFYHCQHRSNTTGGSKAFNIGDPVRVLNPKGSCTPSVTDPFSKMRIVGFSDGVIRACKVAFVLSLSHGDGTIIDNSKYVSYCNISFWDADMVEQTGIIRTYNELTEEHTFEFVPTVLGAGGVATQFYIKGIYTDNSTSFVWYPDVYQSTYETSPPPGSRKSPGDYSFIMPYWRIVNSLQSGSLHDIGGISNTSISVYSSIPYEIVHNVTAPENNPCYIVYAVRGVTGLAGDGERCCQYLSQGVCADVNGPDPAVRMPGGASSWANGGWGNSLLVLDVVSTLVTYQEKTPTRLTALDIHETEVLGADIEGVSRNMTITNNTPSAALWRLWVCSDLCPYKADVNEPYEYLQNKIFISFSADYDFE